MPSINLRFKGECGRTVEGKVWSQGRSYQCAAEGVRVIHYGRAKEDWSKEALRELCSGCRILKAEKLEANTK
jgi:hypothetical protein